MGSSFKFYRSLVLRRLPAMAALFVLFTIAGFATALRLPPTYEAAARLIVETPQIPDELAASTVQISATEEIEFIRQRLFTRTNLLEIQRRFQVLESTDDLSPDEVVEEVRSRADIRSFQGGAGGRRGETRPTLVTVSFKSRSGDIAARVVNEFVTRIINENVSLRTDAAEDTLDFFKQEVDRLSEELAKRSKAISDFQRDNADALPDDLPYRQGRLALLQERIAAAGRERTALVEQKSRIQTAFERTGGVNPNQQRRLTPQEQQLVSLRAQLQQALTVYSETNPNVVSLKNQIANVEAQVEAMGSQPVETTNTAELMLELQMSEIDSRISSLDAEISLNEGIVDELADGVSRTPNVSVTLDELRRDYENVRLQFDTASQSLARANMGERIELTSRGQRITLIEPATVPDSPSSPNRPMVAAAGTGVGIAMALGLFIILEFLNKSIRRPVEMVNALGVTPIATIPYLESNRQRFTRRAFKILLVFGTIIAILGGLFAIDTYYLPLELIVQKILKATGF